MKVCSICSIEKEINEFHRLGKQDNNPRSYCKLCSKEKQKEWDRNRYQRLLRDNPELLKHRERISRKKTKEKHERLGDSAVLNFLRSLKNRHTLSLEDYYWLFEKQNRLCALCRSEVNWQFKGLHVDHDHSCKHIGLQISCKNCIRGLLCNGCNRQHLPWAEKDIELQGPRIREYLTRRPFREKEKPNRGSDNPGTADSR